MSIAPIEPTAHATLADTRSRTRSDPLLRPGGKRVHECGQLRTAAAAMGAGVVAKALIETTLTILTK